MFKVETSGLRRLRQVLYSLLRLGILMMPFGLIAVYYMDRPRGNVIAFYAGLAIFSLSDFFVQSTVRKIEIQPDAGLIRLYLKSPLSGSGEKSFPLNTVKSAIKHYPDWTRIFRQTTVLTISDAGNQVFTITPRYGFSREDLQRVHDRLGSL